MFKCFSENFAGSAINCLDDPIVVVSGAAFILDDADCLWGLRGLWGSGNTGLAESKSLGIRVHLADPIPELRISC